jgi:hypothetical protein
MDAAAAISWSNPSRRMPLLRNRVSNGAALALSLAMALPAAFLLCRRLAGSLTAPCSVPLLIGVGLIAVAAAVAVQLLNQTARSRGSTAQWLSLLAMPAVAMAISLPGSSTFGLSVLWLTVGGGEIGLWQLRKNRRMNPTPDVLDISGRSNSVVPTPHDVVAFDSSSPPSVLQHDATATQKLIYHRAATGAASVAGWLQAQFAAGQRTAILHVAFCPAFEQPPTVEAELVDGPLGDVRPTLVLPWGIRWEVKLDSPAPAPTAATIEFIAHEPC